MDGKEVLKGDEDREELGAARDNSGRIEVSVTLSEGRFDVWSAQQNSVNLAKIYELDVRFDPRLFTRACRQLVAEFAPDRLNVLDTAQGSRQSARPAIEWSQVVCDLSSEPDPAHAAKCWISEDLSEDVESGGISLFTLALLRISAERCVLYQRCTPLVINEPTFAQFSERLAGVYVGLVADIEPQRNVQAADRFEQIHKVEILRPEERQQVIYDFNETAASLPEITLVGMFERQVASTPHRVALGDESRELSYTELDARANQLAWSLIADGIGPEDIVAISMERSIEMVVAILGTLKSGAAYLPLDPDYPAERLTFMTEEARPSRTLTMPLPDLTQFPSAAPSNVDRLPAGPSSRLHHLYIRQLR
jgi:hypothetical protein